MTRQGLDPINATLAGFERYLNQRMERLSVEVAREEARAALEIIGRYGSERDVMELIRHGVGAMEKIATRSGTPGEGTRPTEMEEA